MEKSAFGAIPLMVILTQIGNFSKEHQLKVSIDMPTLIAIAKSRSGQTALEMAGGLHVSPSRISDWNKGHRTPNAEQIAQLARLAGLPIFQTLAALQPDWAEVWEEAGNQAKITSL